MICPQIMIGLMVLMCGYHKSTAEPVLHRVRRIINGDAVPEGRPWMAALTYKRSSGEAARPYSIICGGVLINDRHILLASHCFDPTVVPQVPGDTRFVALGLRDNTFGATDTVQEFAIDGPGATATVQRHPNYVVDTVFLNDIAVITLADPCEMNENVQPVLLPPANIKDNQLTNCQFFGYGVTDLPANVDNLSRYLRTANLGITKKNVCQATFLSLLSEQHLCAAGDSFPCSGDSGSPLMCDFRGQTYLVGLNSFRVGDCNGVGRPQVYTRIASFLGYIRRTTSEFCARRR